MYRMRIKMFLASIGILIVLTTSSCFKETPNRHFTLHFLNSSKYGIYVNSNPNDRDTVCCINNPVTDTPRINPGENNAKALSRNERYPSNSFESMFNCRMCIDTLTVFVFNADTLDYFADFLSWNEHGYIYSWPNRFVIQRYHLSLNDLRNLDWQLEFPPSERMRNIKMWPPYGTYDANGHRIDGK